MACGIVYQFGIDPCHAFRLVVITDRNFVNLEEVRKHLRAVLNGPCPFGPEAMIRVIPSSRLILNEYDEVRSTESLICTIDVTEPVSVEIAPMDDQFKPAYSGLLIDFVREENGHE
jgi:hypothetical protein